MVFKHRCSTVTASGTRPERLVLVVALAVVAIIAVGSLAYVGVDYYRQQTAPKPIAPPPQTVLVSGRVSAPDSPLRVDFAQSKNNFRSSVATTCSQGCGYLVELPNHSLFNITIYYGGIRGSGLCNGGGIYVNSPTDRQTHDVACV